MIRPPSWALWSLWARHWPSPSVVPTNWHLLNSLPAAPSGLPAATPPQDHVPATPRGHVPAAPSGRGQGAGYLMGGRREAPVPAGTPQRLWLWPDPPLLRHRLTWAVGSGQCHVSPETAELTHSPLPLALGAAAAHAGQVARGRGSLDSLADLPAPPLCAGLPGTRRDAAPEAEAGPAQGVLVFLPELADSGHRGKAAFLLRPCACVLASHGVLVVRPAGRAGLAGDPAPDPLPAAPGGKAGGGAGRGSGPWAPAFLLCPCSL